MKIILLLIAVMLLIAGADARYSPGLEIATDENLTLQDGFLTGAGGITFNGTAPSSTTNALYSDSGSLMFNGTEIMVDNLWDAKILWKDDLITAISREGAILDTDADDFGEVFNTARAAICDEMTEPVDWREYNTYNPRTIIIEGGNYTSDTTALLVDNLRVFGIGQPCITVDSDMVVFSNTQTEHPLHRARIENIEIRRWPEVAGTHLNFFIDLKNPQFCDIYNVWATLPYDPDFQYNVLNAGGIRLYQNLSYGAWVNKIVDCHVSNITLDGVTDSFIDHCWVNNYNKAYGSIKLDGGNNKVTNCHINVGKISGLTIADGANFNTVSGNWFEDDGYTNTTSSAGIYVPVGSTTTHNSISGNKFWSLPDKGIRVAGSMSFSSIMGNEFDNCNDKDLGGSDIQIGTAVSGGSQANTIIGNTHSNTVGSGSKGYPCIEEDSTYDPNTNIALGNTHWGSGYAGGYTTIGASSDFSHNI